jgi:hypothetical protein
VTCSQVTAVADGEAAADVVAVLLALDPQALTVTASARSASNEIDLSLAPSQWLTLIIVTLHSVVPLLGDG